MSITPFHKQILPVDYIARIEHDISAGLPVSGADLGNAIEAEVGQLSDRMRAIIHRATITGVKHRGRPKKSRGREDFALLELEERYSIELAKQQEASVKAAPSEAAYMELAKSLKADFPNIDWRALRNKHSAWRTGRFHDVAGDVDSEDFNEAVDQHLPAPLD